ncbi:hypothetical protein KI387_000491, partial [Taxus chinensis]
FILRDLLEIGGGEYLANIPGTGFTGRRIFWGLYEKISPDYQALRQKAADARREILLSRVKDSTLSDA